MDSIICTASAAARNDCSAAAGLTALFDGVVLGGRDPRRIQRVLQCPVGGGRGTRKAPTE